MLAIELHDSEPASVTCVGGSVQVALRPAYVHKCAGTPGADTGLGYLQEAILEFHDGHIAGEVGDLPADIFSGDLLIGGEKRADLIKLPCDLTGAATLTLCLSPDARQISISGLGVSVRPAGEARYPEPGPGWLGFDPVT